MVNWVSKFFLRNRSKNIFSEIEFIPDNSSDKIFLLDEKNLEKIGLAKESFEVHVTEEEKIESTQDYLQKHSIKPSGLTVDEEIKLRKFNHRLNSRNIILWSFIVPMSIIPIWIMILLTLSFSKKIEIKQPVQLTLIGAIAGDFVGLYYVVASDLFSQGYDRRKKDKNSSNDQAETDS